MLEVRISWPAALAIIVLLLIVCVGAIAWRRKRDEVDVRRWGLRVIMGASSVPGAIAIIVPEPLTVCVALACWTIVAVHGFTSVFVGWPQQPGMSPRRSRSQKRRASRDRRIDELDFVRRAGVQPRQVPDVDRAGLARNCEPEASRPILGPPRPIGPTPSAASSSAPSATHRSTRAPVWPAGDAAVRGPRADGVITGDDRAAVDDRPDPYFVW